MNMKTLRLFTISFAFTALLLTGCALFDKNAPQEQKLDQVQLLCTSAAGIGTEVALQEHPEWKPQFELAYQQLDQLVETKTITGAQLRTIISSLPIKELKSANAKIAIDAATMLYDATVGTTVSIEQQPYVLRAATGIRNGMKVPLGK